MRSVIFLTVFLMGCSSLQPVALEKSSSSFSSSISDAEVIISTSSFTSSFSKPSDAELRTQLSPLQYDVTQHEGTEPPFHNEYWDNHEDGIYVDIVSGEVLFSSKDKYESGTGWPSFTRPLAPDNIVELSDYQLLYKRTEVRSHLGDSHLGHVFDDGPEPLGLRYCINSAALRFIPKDQLKAEGYGQFVKYF